MWAPQQQMPQQELHLQFQEVLGQQRCQVFLQPRDLPKEIPEVWCGRPRASIPGPAAQDMHACPQARG